MDLFAERDYNPSKWRIPETLPDLSHVARIGFDTETNGVNARRSKPCGYVLAVPTEPLPPFQGGSLKEWCDATRSRIKSYYLPTGHEGGGNLDRKRVLDYLRRELRGKQLVGSYIKFDAHMSANDGLDLEALDVTCHDVQHRAALLDENQFQYGLDALAKRDLGMEKIKLPFNKDDLWRMPSSEVGEYAEWDGILPLLLDGVYAPRCYDEGLTRVVALEDALTFPVVHMERKGARINVEALERWRKQASAEASQLIVRIADKVGLRVNPDNQAELEWLFVALRLPLPKAVNKKGEEYTSITDDVLKAYVTGQTSCTDGQREVLTWTRRARCLLSLKSRYLDKYPRGLSDDLRLRYLLHQLRSDDYGTVSGRFSSSEIDDDEGCNVQQVMKVKEQIAQLGDDMIVRELFIPEEGYRWARADARQIEFRLFAHDSKSKRLLDAFARDPLTDFHDAVAQMIRRERDFSKQFNFAMLYGMGLDLTAVSLGISSKEAAKIREQYNAEFPEARKLSNEAQDKVKERGFVKTLLGRRRRYPADERGRRIGIHAALNGRIQGSAADVMKLKTVEVYRERKTIGFDPSFIVHDEFDGDLDPDPKYAQRYQELLDRQALPLRVPILWELECGDNWRVGAGRKKAA